MSGIVSLADLKESMNYLHVSELKEYCDNLALSTKGKKIILINRIIHFLNTGEKIEVSKYPLKSLSKPQKNIEITENSLMLKGLYKNDLKNRNFFKSIIGDYFHFTAFGIDFLEECWMRGEPPTYKEFADMWVKEYHFRKLHGSIAKEEWAYINFVKRYLISNPNAPRDKILLDWEIKRKEQKELVDRFLN